VQIKTRQSAGGTAHQFWLVINSGDRQRTRPHRTTRM